MKVVSNIKVIQRNKKIGQYLTFGSLAILAAGLVASFTPQYINLSFLALLVGFILSQIGIYYGTRWGRSPRPDEKLAAKLKGLSENYVLYNYVTDIPHLLIGPAGIWVLLPYYQKGTITYDEQKGRWKQKGGNLYMKMFAQESLGRPDTDVKAVMLDAEKVIKKIGEGMDLPAVQPMLVFINEKAVVSCENAPYPTLPAEKIKDYFRKAAKEDAMSPDIVRELQSKLPKEEDF